MKIISLQSILLLGTAFAQLSANNVQLQESQDYPLFVIDLDLPPRQRFQEVAKYYHDEIISTHAAMVADVPKIINDFFELTYWIWQFTNNEQYEEIKGMTEVIPEISMAQGILTNSLYELESWCTSIVVQMKNGSVIHSRNLDFEEPSAMRKVVYRALFKKNGQYSFDAVMFAGTVGIYTGMKQGAFSVSENQRYPEEHPIYFLENMVMLFGGVDQISWLIRKTLENCEDYECAYKQFSTKTINSLGYITIAGTQQDQGAVISRNRFSAAHIDQLDSQNGKWYVVQANNDQWVDGGCFNRCSSAKDNLDKNGQDSMDINVLRQSVLLLYPNFNYETLYNTQFIPSQGFIDTISLLWPSDDSPMKKFEQSKIIPAPKDYKGKPFKVRDLKNVNIQEVQSTLYDRLIKLVI